MQWVGEAEARRAAEGRLVLVTLICRDAAQPATPVFRPCLAFRVAGSPGELILSMLMYGLQWIFLINVVDGGPSWLGCVPQ